MKGNPAKQSGWMGEHGCKIQFDSNGKGTCEGNDEEYLLQDNTVSRIK